MKLLRDRSGSLTGNTGCLLLCFGSLLLLLLMAANLETKRNAATSINGRSVTATRSPVATPKEGGVGTTPLPTLPVLRSNARPTSAIVGVRQPHRGIWISQEELNRLPVEGEAWEHLRSAAESIPEPDIQDQDSMADIHLFAAALIYARTGEVRYRDSVMEHLEAAIGSEGDPRETSVLAIARNVPLYVIAADLVALPFEPELDSAFRDWLLKLRDTTFHGDGGSYSLVNCHETRPNNFGTHCGAARVAIDRYLDDEADLERAATVFKGWLGDRSAYAGFRYGRLTWQADPDSPVGINPPDAKKEGNSIDGALPEEMRRAGKFRWPPRRTGYAWEALQGAVVQAELLNRAGYPAWEWQEQALLRAVQFLYEIEWEARGDDEWQPWLINFVYGTSFPTRSPAQPGKNMGWTDWTHAADDVSASRNDDTD